MSKPSMAVAVGPLELRNPILTASGTCGYGLELMPFNRLGTLGGVVVKGLSLVGGVTPLALPPGVPLYVDSRIVGLDWVILGGGGRHLKIQVSPTIFEKLGAEIIDELGKE